MGRWGWPTSTAVCVRGEGIHMYGAQALVFINSYIVVVVWILLQVSVAVLLVCIHPYTRARTHTRMHARTPDSKVFIIVVCI